MNKPQIIAIAALGERTHFICDNDLLLWRIPEDLKRVKALTINHPIIMGRKTFESIGHPLPNRTNIVLTRDVKYSQEGIRIVHSMEEALTVAKESAGGNEKIIIFGGADIYELFLPITDILMLTLVDSDKKGTRSFPEFNDKFVQYQENGEGVYNDGGVSTPYRWVNFERK